MISYRGPREHVDKLGILDGAGAVFIGLLHHILELVLVDGLAEIGDDVPQLPAQRPTP